MNYQVNGDKCPSKTPDIVHKTPTRTASAQHTLILHSSHTNCNLLAGSLVEKLMRLTDPFYSRRYIVIAFIALAVVNTREVTAMRLVLQRVKSASVRVEGEIVSSIGPGVMALVGLHEDDTEDNLKECCKKLLAAKLWANENGGQWR